MDSSCRISAMLDGLESPHGLERVAERVAAVTIDHLVRLLGAGWGPDDLVRTIRRRTGSTAASIVAGPLTEAVHRRDAMDHPQGAQSPRGAGGDARPFDPLQPGWLDELPARMDALEVI